MDRTDKEALIAQLKYHAQQISAEELREMDRTLQRNQIDATGDGSFDPETWARAKEAHRLLCEFMVSVGKLAAILFVVLAFAAPARAQDDAEAEARALFKAGRVAFDDGRYEAAIDLWRASYERSSEPALLYNIGTALDRMGKPAAAAQAFTRYLARAEHVDAPAEVEARIARLRNRNSEPTERTSSEGSPPGADLQAPGGEHTTSAPVESDKGSLARRYAYVWAAAGGALATSALAAGAWGRAGGLAAREPAQIPRAKVKRLERTAQATLGLTAALAAAGLVLTFTVPGPGEGAEVTMAASSGGVQIEGRF